MARINLVLPDEQMDQVRAVSAERKEVVTETLRRFVRLGLLVDEMEKQGNELIIRSGETEQRLILL